MSARMRVGLLLGAATILYLMAIVMLVSGLYLGTVGDNYGHGAWNLVVALMNREFADDLMKKADKSTQFIQQRHDVTNGGSNG